MPRNLDSSDSGGHPNHAAPPLLMLIDGIGPFFRGMPPGRINWSKVPFHRLERDGRLDEDCLDQVRVDFAGFVERVSGLGFNAITLDDVAHIVDSDLYPPALREKIRRYRAFYRDLFQTARNQGLKIFLTTDVMFYHESSYRALGRSPEKVLPFLQEALRALFRGFPEVAGIIFRIGETDGMDVQGDFRSRLAIRTPDEARRYVKELLPIFEWADRLMVFRTWSVGTHRIGDLIWNRNTFHRTFGDLNSPNLVLSLKYGESDFFRFLPLNKLFFYSSHRKIIELQARREYEGSGVYPSFIGWDYESYARDLASAHNVVGAWIWCQTGGWTPFYNLTYLDRSSIWNEINTFVSLRVFKDGWTTEQAVEAFHREYVGRGNWSLLLQVLRLSDEVAKELLYIEEFSRRKIFFRRLRLPPLLWAFWDQIIVNHAMKRLLRLFVADREAAVSSGYTALQKIRLMREKAEELGLPTEGIEFQYDTFEILAAVREYFFGAFSEELVQRLHNLREAYRAKYSVPYDVHLNFRRTRVHRGVLQMATRLLLRHQRGYRLRDKIFTLHMLALFYPVLRIWQRRWVPEFARTQAMGIDAVFK